MAEVSEERRETANDGVHYERLDAIDWQNRTVAATSTLDARRNAGNLDHSPRIARDKEGRSSETVESNNLAGRCSGGNQCRRCHGR